jgi:hypothetical protein
MDKGLFQEIRQTGREAYHSVPTNIKVKNTWMYTSIPPHVKQKVNSTLSQRI